VVTFKIACQKAVIKIVVEKFCPDFLFGEGVKKRFYWNLSKRSEAEQNERQKKEDIF